MEYIKKSNQFYKMLAAINDTNYCTGPIGTWGESVYKPKTLTDHLLHARINIPNYLILFED